MKVTLVIADDLFNKVQEVAHNERTTVQALTEQGLRLVLKAPERRRKSTLPPLVTFRGRGMRRALRHATWEQIRTLSYGEGPAAVNNRPAGSRRSEV